MNAMTTKTTTDLWDLDANGFFDSRTVTTEITDAAGKLEYRLEATDNDNDGVFDWNSFEDQAYLNGKLDHVDRGFDGNGDGIFEQVSTESFAYDKKGRLDYGVTSLPDTNGDGRPDWQTITDTIYNKKGQVAELQTTYVQDGELNPYEYRSEWFKYDGKGRVVEHTIDDPVVFDFIVSDGFKYDKKGRLIEQTHTDPYDFGDDAPHTVQTISYDKQGRPATMWQYDEFLGGSHVAEVNTKFIYHSGVWTAEEAEGKDFQGALVERQLTERWANSLGQVTHTLISQDADLDGSWDAGTRTLIVIQYAPDGQVASEMTDFNAGDGVIEHSVVSEWMLA
jgi:hypothetical protein